MVDFIIKLLLVAGKNVILVMYNILSKITNFVTIIKEISVEKLVKLFRNYVWKLHRLLESIISDKGLQFAVELMRKLNKMLEIEMMLLIIFYPQTDEQIE